MFIDTITYTDFNDEEQTETVCFNLSKAEIIDMQISEPNGYDEYLKKIVESNDQQKIMNTFIDIIKMTYGVKSEDGKRFIKNDELTEEFTQTAAYDEFLMKIMSDEDYAVKFVQGILPKVDNIVDIQRQNA